MPATRRSMRSQPSLTRQRSPSPTVGLAMSRPRRAASGANRSSISVARSSPSPDEAKKSIHLNFKMPPSKLRERTGGSKRNASVGGREGLESSEVVRAPRGSRAKRAVVVESESDEEEEEEEEEEENVGGEEDDGEGEEDEEADEEEEEEEEEDVEEDPDADAEGDDQDADGDVDMNDAEPQPPPPILKVTGPPSKPTIAVTPAQVGKVKSVEAKEMEGDDDDEELSDLGSEGEEDAEGDEDDMEQEIEGRSMGEGSRSSTPDLSKMTKRQRSRLDQVMGSDFLQLPMEPQIKKHLTAEEHAMRRSEMARRRKNLSEKRNEEEKLDTINRLLKKQAPKRRGKISAEEIATNAMAPSEPSDIEFEKPNPVYVRWVSDKDGSRVGVPSEWLEDGLENTIGKVFMGSGRRRMVEETNHDDSIPYILSKQRWPLPNGWLRPYVSPRRFFYSAQKLLSEDNSTPTSEIPHNHLSSSLPDISRAPSNAIPEQGTAGDGDPKPTKPVERAHYGSASRRAGRNIKKSNGIPPCHLPQRFLEQNVTIDYHETLAPLQSAVDRKERSAVPSIEELDLNVWLEIELMVRAGLEPPAASHDADAPFSAKQHLVLHCPREGSTHTLDALVKSLARKNSADLIRIEAQDIAEIGGNYLDEPGLPPNGRLSMLSYEVHAATHERNSIVQDLIFDDNSDVGDEEESRPHQPMPVIKAVTLQDVTGLFKGKHAPFGQVAKPTIVLDDTKSLKLETFVDTLLHACSTKRVMAHDRTDKDEMTYRPPESCDMNQDSVTKNENVPTSPPPVIVQVNDYPEICNDFNGGRVMDALHDALYERRKEGQRFLLIGTCAARDLHTASPRPGGGAQMRDSDTSPTTTILVPTTQEMEKVFKLHHADRTKAINVRHLKDMIRRLAPDPRQVSGVVSESNLLVETSTTQGYLKDCVWSADQVHQIATLAIGGMILEKKDMSAKHIRKAITIALRSNEAKRDWISEEKKRDQQRQKGDKDQIKSMKKKGMSSGALQAKLRSQCNKHEKRLLHGVVDPSSIRTTFADVRAPEETKETLKTLTSLSLLRPDAFTYGVLATDKITGVLLYGPPGTGKTMLAKAVAKESGATVLEVSGADLYNMWVGEGEKNVKAIFSLAKKLTPCIVFIDEADAILGSRSGSSNRVSHRELINQFLREWDGMGEVSAFIMVATNRPFDLDEATLRRLPRRMLVDLPTEHDRQEILKIHLKDEILDSQISLQQLAAETPLYSGSDLKNICVAAALACVREEYDADTKRASSVITGSPGCSPSSSLQTLPTVAEANAPVQERPPLSSAPSHRPSPQPLSKNHPLKHSTSLSEALAATSSSSNALFECFSSVTEFIDSLQKTPAPLVSMSSAISADTEQPTSTIQPPDASSTPPAASGISLGAEARLEDSNLGPSASIMLSDVLPLETSSSSSEAKPSPPKRILRRHHFERALEEISASISDDMRSLTQIRKFDEKYGDRRARKGKLSGRYGFGTLNEKEREKIGQSAARVRLAQLS
ncbi:MAG: hypothetical protein Q9226_001440 [Calogaya cf. arnoldii]